MTRFPFGFNDEPEFVGGVDLNDKCVDCGKIWRECICMVDENDIINNE